MERNQVAGSGNLKLKGRWWSPFTQKPASPNQTSLLRTRQRAWRTFWNFTWSLLLIILNKCYNFLNVQWRQQCEQQVLSEDSCPSACVHWRHSCALMKCKCCPSLLALMRRSWKLCWRRWTVTERNTTRSWSDRLNCWTRGRPRSGSSKVFIHHHSSSLRPVQIEIA